jgi:phospholipid N-methyltransferase
MRSKLRFLSAFLANPATIGAVAPSSRGLAREITSWIDWPNASNVVEYGPGTGAFTEEILTRLGQDCRFFAIEIQPELVETMRKRFPTLTVYQDSVANLKTLCEAEGIGELDAVISGLPWAAFSEDQQSQFMEATISVLRPGGQFVTFAYLQGLLLTAGRSFRHLLHERFSEVTTSRTVWLNLPPAFVYRCRR